MDFIDIHQRQTIRYQKYLARLYRNNTVEFAADFQVEERKTLHKRVGVEDVWVELIPCDARRIEGSIGLEKAKCKGMWLDADLEYIIEPDRLKEQIILYSQGLKVTLK